MKTVVYRSLALTMASVLLASIATAADAEQVVEIGHVAPLTGGIAHLGKDSEDGARIAVEEINQSGLTIGGQSAPVAFAGLVPGFVGLFQINTQVPSGVQSGSVAVQITVAGQVSPTVPIAIR